jgi:hypothetical protein
MPNYVPWLCAAVLAAVPLVSGCPNQVDLVPAFPAGCDAEPVFSIISPSPDGDTVVSEAELPVEIEISVFTLVDKLNQPPAPCEGHLHVFIDGDLKGMLTTAQFAVDLSGLEPGEHTLRVAVHGNDHSPIADIPRIEVSFQKE